MGFLAPLAAGIGSALAGGGAAASTFGLVGATGLIGKAVGSILGGKKPDPVAAATPAPPITPPSPTPISAVPSARNKSLASLSPGLALGGTNSLLGGGLGSPTGSTQKTLLGR